MAGVFMSIAVSPHRGGALAHFPAPVVCLNVAGFSSREVRAGQVSAEGFQREISARTMRKSSATIISRGRRLTCRLVGGRGRKRRRFSLLGLKEEPRELSDQIFLEFELDRKTLKQVEILAREAGCGAFEMCVKLLQELLQEL